MTQHELSLTDAAQPFWFLDSDRYPQPLVIKPPASHCDVCVVVPVRDERDTLEATLTALSDQVDLDGRRLDPQTYEIIVLANNCRDDSAAIARDFAACRPEIALHVIELDLPAADSHVGKARRILMDEACHRLTQLGKARGIIATTDGDTRVFDTWIAANRKEILLGADAVGGRIRADSRELQALCEAGRRSHLHDVGYRWMATELESRLDPDRHDPWPRHFQHFGASLAVTAEAYLRAGGLPAQPWLEDVAFYNALMRVDARFRHSLAVQVTTSARSIGRTEFGFAVQLGQWEGLNLRTNYHSVESVPGIEARVGARQQLRLAWHLQRHTTSISTPRLNSLAADLGLDPGWLKHTLRQPQPFGMLLERVERAQQETGCWLERWPLVDIRDANWQLRCRLDFLRRATVLPEPLEKIEPVEAGPLALQVD